MRRAELTDAQKQEQEWLNMPNGVPYQGFKDVLRQRADEVIRGLKG